MATNKRPDGANGALSQALMVACKVLQTLLEKINIVPMEEDRFSSYYPS